MIFISIVSFNTDFFALIRILPKKDFAVSDFSSSAISAFNLAMTNSNLLLILFTSFVSIFFRSILRRISTGADTNTSVFSASISGLFRENIILTCAKSSSLRSLSRSIRRLFFTSLSRNLFTRLVFLIRLSVALYLFLTSVLDSAT